MEYFERNTANTLKLTIELLCMAAQSRIVWTPLHHAVLHCETE